MSVDGEIERNSIISIRSDNRPTDFEYALLSKHVYGSVERTKPLFGSYFYATSGKWSVLRTKRVFCGYFGAIYICEETKAMVVAHRGTNSIRDVFEDIRAIFFNQYSTPQQEAAFSLVTEAVNLVKTDNRFTDFHLSFTGHSLGAFLAEVSVYHAQSVLGFRDVNAVTFESPGSKSSILATDEVNGLGSLIGTSLDIVSYVCYPNLINVCNEHIGTVYSINVDLGVLGSLPILHLLRCHSIDGIVEWFRQAVTEKNPICKRHYMSDWPVGYREGRVYFKYAEFDNGQYTIKRPLRTTLSRLREFHDAEEVDVLEGILTLRKKKFQLQFNGNFKIHDNLSSSNVLPLRHFRTDLQLFLRHFHNGVQALQSRTSHGICHLVKLLEEKWRKLEMPVDLIKHLLHFRIRRNNIDIDVAMIDVEGVSVSCFRRQLSSWLERKQLSVQDLLDVDTSFPDSDLPVL